MRRAAALVVLAATPLVFGDERRASVTFVLGVDEDPGHPLMANAERFYRLDADEGTDRVVTTLRSLCEVRDYLAAEPPENGRPWGHVNIVAHANGWGEIALPVTPGGEPASAASLASAMREGRLSPLPETIVDSATTVHAIGCALGLDVPLLRLVARALGGEDAERPTVYSSKLWAAFAPDPSRTAGVSRYLADGWIVCVHPDADADKRKIARLFRARYPNDAVDWEDALTRPSPRFLGDTYSRTARGDFHFKSVFSSRELSPRLAHRSGQIAWLTGHTSLLAELAARGLDWKSHYWDVHPGIHVTPEGTRLPALVADGVCRVIIVSRVRTAPNPNDPDAVVPLRPPLTDERFYTAAH